MASSMGDSSLLEQPWCEICHAKDPLRPCPKCGLVYYCSPEHQLADVPGHRDACKVVSTYKAAGSLTAERLRPGAVWGTSDCSWNLFVLEHHSTHMRSLRRIGTRSALEAVIEMDSEWAPRVAALHSVSDFRHDSSSPGLYLRLGREQDCYDCITSDIGSSVGHSASQGGRHAPAEPSDGLEDVTQLVDKLAREPCRYNRLVFLILFNIRLLFKLRTAHETIFLRCKLPMELLYMIRCYIMEPFAVRNPDLIRDLSNGASLRPHILKVLGHIDYAFDHVQEWDPHIWPSLVARRFYPDTLGMDLTVISQAEESRSPLERCSYTAWLETPGALEMIEAKLRAKGWSPDKTPE